jgi:hypothetical protein
MKRLLFLLSFSLTFILAKAQLDTLHMPLKAWHYGFIYELLPEKNSPEEFIFVKQAALKWDGIDTAQVITVAASYDLVERTFRFLSNVREGVATMPNEEMLLMITPAIMRHPELALRLFGIRDENAKAKQDIITKGLQKFSEIKKMWSY